MLWSTRAVLCLLWLGGVGAGWTLLSAHTAEAGRAASSPAATAPAATGHLLVFAHPQCPCTPASLRTLARLLRHRPAARVDVFMMVPDAADTAWQRGPIWELADRLPGATVHADVRGRVARQYGVYTSGQVLYYDATGTLRFAGGLTPGRGHEGVTSGQHALARALDAAVTADATPPVYGCALHDSSPLAD